MAAPTIRPTAADAVVRSHQSGLAHQRAGRAGRGGSGASTTSGAAVISS